MNIPVAGNQSGYEFSQIKAASLKDLKNKGNIESFPTIREFYVALANGNLKDGPVKVGNAIYRVMKLETSTDVEKANFKPSTSTKDTKFNFGVIFSKYSNTKTGSLGAKVISHFENVAVTFTTTISTDNLDAAKNNLNFGPKGTVQANFNIGIQKSL